MTVIARVVDSESVTWFPALALESALPEIRVAFSRRPDLTPLDNTDTVVFFERCARLERQDGGDTYIYRLDVI